MVAQANPRRLPEARESHVLLFPRQMRFVKDTARFPAYVGGIGSGKTFAGAVKVLARLDRRELGMVAAPTYSMLRDATQRTLLGLMDRTGITYERHKAEGAIRIPASGHEIIFRSLDDPEKVRGPNLNYAWVDEGSLVDRMAWSIVKGRVRVGVNPQAWLTCTPKGRNYVWEEWERDANPDHPLYRVRTDENPELPEGFAESLGYTGVFAAQELGGEFVAFEGLVWPGFTRPTHVERVECAGWRAVLGVDIGTRNPTCVLVARGDEDRRHIESEIYRSGLSSEEIIATVEAECDRVRADAIYADPSAAAYIETWQRHGYPAKKAENDVSFGIGIVATGFANGMTIDPSCVNLISEIESYHYPENKTDSDKPVKQFDHAVDCLRYLCASEANVITPGIWVLA
jgi:PBSX family phage terminase large subunit